MGTCTCIKNYNKHSVLPKAGKSTSSIGIKAKDTSVRNSLAIWVMPSEYADKIEKLKMEKLSPLNLNLSQLYCRRKSRYDLKHATRV